MTLPGYTKTTLGQGQSQKQRPSQYQVVVTFNDETLPKQMDIFLASSQTEAKEKATAAYGRYGIKSIYCELYRN